MSCLPSTFTLTPVTPMYQSGQDLAWIGCYGTDIDPGSPDNLPSLYANNQFHFDYGFSADPTQNYTNFSMRRTVPFIELYVNMPSVAKANKQLALIFGFTTEPYSIFGTVNWGQVLVYTDAGFLQKQMFQATDNQFLLEIDSLASSFYLYFIHAGGDWFFNGISGYLV